MNRSKLLYYAQYIKSACQYTVATLSCTGCVFYSGGESGSLCILTDEVGPKYWQLHLVEIPEDNIDQPFKSDFSGK